MQRSEKISCFLEAAKYASFSMLGSLGLSCYILADTYFISKGLGADGGFRQRYQGQRRAVRIARRGLYFVRFAYAQRAHSRPFVKKLKAAVLTDFLIPSRRSGHSEHSEES